MSIFSAEDIDSILESVLPPEIKVSTLQEIDDVYKKAEKLGLNDINGYGYTVGETDGFINGLISSQFKTIKDIKKYYAMLQYKKWPELSDDQIEELINIKFTIEQQQKLYSFCEKMNIKD